MTGRMATDFLKGGGQNTWGKERYLGPRKRERWSRSLKWFRGPSFAIWN